MSESTRRILIKVLTGSILVLLAWPIPRMVTFCNPDDGIILGCFTPTYSLLLAGYLFITLVWATLTLWALVRLEETRLEALRSLIRIRPYTSALVLGVAALGPALLRGLSELGWIVLPELFVKYLEVLPLIAGALFVVGAKLIVNDDTLKAVEAAVRKRLDPLIGWAARVRLFGREVNWGEISVVVVLALMAGVLLAQSAQPRLWDKPLTADASFHLYIGEHVLRGGIPYITVIYEKPLVRFLISALWGLGARLTGLPLVTFVRGLDLLLSCFVLILVYLIGQRFTGRRIGGLIAAAIMLGCEQIQLVYIEGPVFRITAVLFAVLAVWLSQERRWFWAEVVAFFAWGLWQPAAVLVGAIGLAALLSSREDGRLFNLRAMLEAAAGALIPIAIMVIALLIIGDAKEAYQQSILAIWMYVTKQTVEQVDVNPSIQSLFDIQLLRKVRKLYLSQPGDEEFMVLMLLGGVLVFFVYGLRKVLREPKYASPLLAAGTMAVVVLYDFRGSYRDSIMLFPFLTVFGALAIIWIFVLVGGWRKPSTPWLSRVLGIVALMAVILVGWGESSKEIARNYLAVTGSLSEQTRLSRELAARLAPDDKVVSIWDVWPLVLAERDNGIALRFLRYRFPILEASGLTPTDFQTELQEAHPVVIFAFSGSVGRYETDWLQEEYVNMGVLDNYYMVVYVRNDRADIQAVVSGWDLQPNP